MKLNLHEFITLSTSENIGVLYHFTTLSGLIHLSIGNFVLNEYSVLTKDYNLYNYHGKKNIYAYIPELGLYVNEVKVRIAFNADILSKIYDSTDFTDAVIEVNILRVQRKQNTSKFALENINTIFTPDISKLMKL